MADIIRPSFMTTLDVPPGEVIAGASEAKLETVIVVGQKEDGEFYFAASSGKAPEILWLLKRAQDELIERAKRGGR